MATIKKKKLPKWIEYLYVTFTTVVILFGTLFLGYEFLLDGTVFNPVVKYYLPVYKGPDASFIQPSPIGNIAGIYAVQTDKTSYKIGEPIHIKNDFCKLNNDTPQVRVSLVDTVVTSTNFSPGAITEAKCYHNTDINITTISDKVASASLEKDEYRAYVEVVHTINPFRKISYILVSNYFTVSK